MNQSTITAAQATRLAAMVLKLATTARTSDRLSDIEAADHQARGATLFAMTAGIIDGDAYLALCNLSTDARYQRSTELIFDQPLYTGADRARARHSAALRAAV
ncbi:TPA: hypothetical protein L4G84_000613 [Pseudomonas aeruginosa]|nr:hypothetical protein [Pseudomonas aeruginosa]